MASVADEIDEALKAREIKVSWWRKVVIIFVANCFATLIAGGLLGFFTILWTKANASDKNAEELRRYVEVSEARHRALLRTVATLQASQKKDEGFIGPLLPGETLAPEPTASAVEEAEEMIQQQVDKAVYREQR